MCQCDWLYDYVEIIATFFYPLANQANEVIRISTEFRTKFETMEENLITFVLWCANQSTSFLFSRIFENFAVWEFERIISKWCKIKCFSWWYSRTSCHLCYLSWCSFPSKFKSHLNLFFVSIFCTIITDRTNYYRFDNKSVLSERVMVTLFLAWEKKIFDKKLRNKKSHENW